MLFLFYRFSSSGGFSWSFLIPLPAFRLQLADQVKPEAFTWTLYFRGFNGSFVVVGTRSCRRRPEDRWCRPALTCLEGVGRSRFSLSHWFTCRKPCPVVHGSSPYRHEIPKTLNFCHVHMRTQTYGHNARWPKSKSSNGVPTAGLSLIWPPLYVGKWPSPTSARTQTNAGDGQ